MHIIVCIQLHFSNQIYTCIKLSKIIVRPHYFPLNVYFKVYCQVYYGSAAPCNLNVIIHTIYIYILFFLILGFHCRSSNLDCQLCFEGKDGQIHLLLQDRQTWLVYTFCSSSVLPCNILYTLYCILLRIELGKNFTCTLHSIWSYSERFYKVFVT